MIANVVKDFAELELNIHLEVLIGLSKCGSRRFHFCCCLQDGLFWRFRSIEMLRVIYRHEFHIDLTARRETRQPLF